MLKLSTVKAKADADFKPIAPEAWSQILRNFERVTRLIRKAGKRK